MRKIHQLFFAALFLTSCDKNKEVVQFTDLYHIEGNDTISAVSIPNAFTPDGDGQNDLWKICRFNGMDSTNFRIRIYNSNGEVFFETENPGQYWDGSYKSTRAENGIYDYHLEAIDTAGFSYNYYGKVHSLF